MLALDQQATLAILDGIASVLYAAAVTFRARSLGANLAGAVILACLCALAPPAILEALLHGSEGAAHVLRTLPDDAAIGAFAGLAAIMIWRQRPDRLFFWLDGASVALGASLYTLLAAGSLGLAGGLALGLACGFTPGLIRDIALGDTAQLLEKNWYAAAAFVGCLVALALDALLFVWICAPRHLEWSIMAGFGCTLALRGWKGRD